MTNRAKDILLELGCIDEGSVERLSARVRDREDVGVLRDARSGVVFLDRTDHMDITHYEEVEAGSYWGGATRAEALKNYAEDDVRRAQQFAALLAGKDVVDVGCGTGGFLDLVRPHTKSVAGVEPQTYIRDELVRAGHTMYRLPEDMPSASFDVATLFHTLEHVVEPLDVLRQIKRALRPGGLLIVEIPHGRDALLALDAFRQFSLWSEHLILHTKESLKKFLTATGFSDARVEGHQRYPLANHLGWLIEGKPGGQKKFSDLADETTAAAYARHLVEADKTDTLIATARI